MMRFRWLFRCTCLIATLILPVLPSAGQAGTLEVRGLGQAVVSLDGPWRFHPGDDLRWADPRSDDRQWPLLHVNDGWGAQGYFARDGFGWYRLHLDVQHTPNGPQELALFLPRAQDAYEVYWNGRLLGQQGRLPPHASWPAYPLPHTFQLGADSNGVLAIRAWKAPLLSFEDGTGGGLSVVPQIGSPAAIAQLFRSRSFDRLEGVQFLVGLSLFYLLVAAAGIGGWLQHREQPLLLWLGLFALASVLQLGWWHEVLGFTYVQEGLAAMFYQSLEDISAWFLLVYLLGLRQDPRILRWIRILAAFEVALLLLDGLSIVCWARGWPQVLDGVVSEVILLPELFPILLVWAARRNALPVSTWLVAAFTLLTDLTLEVGAFLSQGDRFTHWTFWQKLIRPVFTVAGNPFTLHDLSAVALLCSLIAAVYRSTVEESRRQAELEREFHSAQELQRVLIPEDLPTVLGFEISSAYRPAREVGGDFFQLLPQGGGSALLLVGDVSGKGLTAAMAVALIIGTVRTLAEQLPSPAEMLAGINRRLYGKLHGGFATCLVLGLSPSGEVVMASAGHPGPILNGEEVDLSPALPLGLSLDAEYEQTSLWLAVGDRLLLFSDGLPEARSGKGELFGFERVRALAQGCPDATETANAAIAFGQEDDITVVTVTRLRVGAESRAVVAAPTLVDLKATGLLSKSA